MRLTGLHCLAMLRLIVPYIHEYIIQVICNWIRGAVNSSFILIIFMDSIKGGSPGFFIGAILSAQRVKIRMAGVGESADQAQRVKIPYLTLS